MSAAAYLVGRTQRLLDLHASTLLQPNTLYASQRLDGETLTDLKFEHSTFANVSFKRAVLDGCTFVDCVFAACYFKGVKIKNCRFEACRFIDCNLEKVGLDASDFRYYADFTRCYIEFGELEPWLPTEPNLCSRLTHNLARACEQVGAFADAKRYRQRAAEERERHWQGQYRNTTQFYRDHYGEPLQRLAALGRVARSRAWGWSYGHGSSGPVLARNFIAITFIVFPFLLFLTRRGIAYRGTGTSPAYLNLVVASLDNMLPLAGLIDLRYSGFWPRTLLALETGVGLFLIGLAVSLAFRTVIERSR